MSRMKKKEHVRELAGPAEAERAVTTCEWQAATCVGSGREFRRAIN